MARLPVEQQRIGKGIDQPICRPAARSRPDQGSCQNPDCEYSWTDRHHIVRRSHLGGPFNWVEIDGVPRPNIAYLCMLCHEKLERNEEQIIWDDGWSWGVDNPLDPPLDTGLHFPSAGASPPLEPSVERMGASVREGPQGAGRVFLPPSAPGPGQECPSCHRRVPHPKTAVSPSDTKQLNLGKGPADAVARLQERYDEFLEASGLNDRKYPRLKALDLLLILVGAVERDALRNYVEHVEKDLGWAA